MVTISFGLVPWLYQYSTLYLPLAWMNGAAMMMWVYWAFGHKKEWVSYVAAGYVGRSRMWNPCLSNEQQLN